MSIPDELADLAPLLEPTRLEVYRLLRERHPEAAGRDEVARRLGISRPLAAFHLDRLLAAGLAEVAYRRLNGRSGPGAGRPAKLYLAREGDVAASVPPRSYDLAGRLLSRTVRGLGGRAGERLQAEARRHGRGLGHRGGRTELVAALARLGYQPEGTPAELSLRNCPFHALAVESADPVCAMNQALLEGLCESTRAAYQARLDPQPGWCCVRLTPQKTMTARSSEPATIA